MLLWLAVVVSAVAAVTVRHQNRLAFIAWRGAEAAQVELQSDLGRLMLEKTTLVGRRNLVEDARSRLAMDAPAPNRIITLQLERAR
ncbi:MAG: cell division protein FtsL [bacterium]